MEYFNNIFNATHEVYKEKKYYFISGITSLLIYSLNALFHNFKLVFSENFKWGIVFSLIRGFHNTMASYSVVFLVVISLLTGVLISMGIYLVKRQISSGIYAGGTGIIMSIIAPACSSCALGLVGLLGLGGFLSILPFKGAEIGLLGIAVVIIALIIISKKVVTQTCEIK
jgi:hypothetical protein